ncbi:MAG TPA: glutathione-disulfide reductase [Roseiarcus sp.]|jgi:glutathione reductase (NADPH)|nr:glutathione-disulfide reductase [Roseiarcus sp.]
MAFDIDFFVIGAGSGGVRAARIAAGHGAKTLVAEESRIGGTCVIRGCVPKKLYVHASRFADDFRDAAGFGWSVGEPTFDWPTLVKAKDKEIGRLSDAYRDNLARSGAKLVEQRATVVDPHRVRLADGREISARHILIACGSRPVRPTGVKGLQHAITSNEIFDLPVFPRSLLVVGGGYIAVEFASLFQRLGSQVTMVMRGPNLLRGFDEDMRNGMRDAMANAGIVHRFGRVPTTIEKERDGSLRVTLSDDSVVEADQALFATGRNPYTKDLGLEAAGVELSAEHGAVKVNENLTSNVPSVHAIGDATHRVDLTPVAIREGHTLADRLFGPGAGPLRYDTIGSTVFGTPELGAVGLTESEALQRFPKVHIYKTNFRPLKATVSGSPERTLMKLVVEGSTERVVGAHILGGEAAEMIQLVAVAMTMGATKADFDATIAVHPTAAEELVTMRSAHARYEDGMQIA